MRSQYKDEIKRVQDFIKSNLNILSQVLEQLESEENIQIKNHIEKMGID